MNKAHLIEAVSLIMFVITGFDLAINLHLKEKVWEIIVCIASLIGTGVGLYLSYRKDTSPKKPM